MENRINQTLVINDELKYLILRQAIYNNENYFACTRISEDGNSLTEDFELLHEIKKEDKTYVEIVQDEKLANLILSKLGLLD